MFKGHMSVLYVGRIKFLTNQFIENLCPYKTAKASATIRLTVPLFFFFLNTTEEKPKSA
jgi:hypothetical protein